MRKETHNKNTQSKNTRKKRRSNKKHPRPWHRLNRLIHGYEPLLKLIQGLLALWKLYEFVKRILM